MSEYTERMLQYVDGELNPEQSIFFEKELFKNASLRKKYALNQDIDECMKGLSLINQINDKEEADLVDIDAIAKNDIADYLLDESGSETGLKFFINGALAENDLMEKMIDEAEREMSLLKIEEETKDWVDEWTNLKKQLENDPKTQKIIDYVQQGMENDFVVPKLNPRKTSVKFKLLRVVSIAAVLIISFGFWMIFSSSPSSEELFAEYYQPYEVFYGQTRNSEKDIKKLEIDAIKLYKNKMYNEAVIKFQTLLSSGSTEKIKLLYSITQIELKDYENAILNLEEIIQTNVEYVIEAKWYLALCYLKIDKKDKAKTLFEELALTPGYYKNSSEELLEDL